MPLFVSSSSDVLFDKIMVIILLLVPVWIILRSYFKTRKFHNLNDEAYNKSFIPPDLVERDEIVDDSKDLTIYKKYRILIVALSVFGLAGIFMIPPKDYSNLNLTVDRNHAIEISDKYLLENNIILDNTWTMLTDLKSGSIGIEDRFVWNKEGRDFYDKLMGRYLDNYIWNIRYVKFEGNIDEKTEEYSVFINSDGTLNQIRHKYPENAVGERVNEKSARKISQEYIYDKFLLSNNNLDKISATPSNLTNRDDWAFIYKNNLESSDNT